MKSLVTVQKWLHLWCFFSIVVLHSVSAGGAYCAKTAQARAAALGLEYPGVHGAPDLSSPVHYVKQPRTFSYDEMSWTPPNIGIYSHHQPGVSPFDKTYEQVRSRSSEEILPSHDAYMMVQGGSRTNQMLSFPRGLTPVMLESSFEEIRPAPLSHLDRMTPRGHRVYKKHDLDDEESAPNGREVPRHGPFWPLSWGPATRGTLRKVVPSPHSPHHFKKDKKSRGPVYGNWKMIRFPHRLVQHLHKTLNPEPFHQGKIVLKRQEKTKLRLKMKK